MDSNIVLKAKEILVDNWENAFFVKETSSEVYVYVELKNTDEDSGLWSVMPMRIEDKYVKIFKVPVGYINGIIRLDSKT
tara:strand:- start:1299 stop:1535 length:237 start_codon:yes stop_codon:yes gene_type:complete